MKAVYSGLAIDVQRHLLYFSDEGQGQVGELELKLKLNHTADVTSRIVDSTDGSKPRSIAVDVVNTRTDGLLYKRGPQCKDVAERPRIDFTALDFASNRGPLLIDTSQAKIILRLYRGPTQPRPHTLRTFSGAFRIRERGDPPIIILKCCEVHSCVCIGREV